MKQLDIFYTEEQLRDKATEKVEETANTLKGNWSNKAYYFFLQYLRSHQIFTTEQVRMASKDFMPEPHDQRAWGPIAARVRREGFIRKISYQDAESPQAHCAPKAVWQRIKKP